MKIVPYIILLLSCATLWAQETEPTALTSVNVMASRSALRPLSEPNVQEASKNYSLELSEWEQQSSGEGRQFTSSFTAPFSWSGRKAFIAIESASAPYVVTIGGRVVGEVNNPSMPAQIDVTRYIKHDAPVVVAIDMQPSAHLEELGAWGSGEVTLGRVSMLSQPTMYIREVEVSTKYVAGVLNSTIAIIVKSDALNERTSRINYELITPQGRVASRGFSDVTLDMRREDTIYMFTFVPDSLAWSASSPSRYRLNLSTQYRGRHLEYISLDLGLRSIDLNEAGELIVNGVSEGALRAEILPATATVDDLVAAKAAGYNAVKIAAGVYNSAIYECADSVGLYVVASAPIATSHSGDNILRGGNPTNDPSREGEFLERVDALYNTTKNFASVVAYSLAEESPNGYNLYESYLYLKQKEPQRPIVNPSSAGQWNGDRLKIEFSDRK